MPNPTPLLQFLRHLTTDQQKQLAETCGTTRGYLYQLAGSPRPNPQLRLSIALCKESRQLARRIGAKPLTLEDLLIGVEDEET